MRRFTSKIAIGFFVLLSVGSGALFLLAQKERPAAITYGASFNTFYAQELGLDWQETYDAMIDDLGVRHFRLAAHWPMVEPRPDVYNFAELDYQVRRASEVGATVIMSVGRRLPRWPECHVPAWAKALPQAEADAALLQYISEVVKRYRNSPAVVMWQIENEPFLKVFAFEHCGTLDTGLLDQEINFVRELDGTRPILLTDSGNLGTWHGAYKRGDQFGSSVYVHFWNPELGQFKTILPPWAYRVKDNLMALRYGEKPTLLIELSAEPWLVEPITAVPVSTQYTRMDIAKFRDIVSYASDTHFEYQYLWGAEWWYWLKVTHDDPTFWEYGKTLFVKENVLTSVK